MTSSQSLTNHTQASNLREKNLILSGNDFRSILIEIDDELKGISDKDNIKITAIKNNLRQPPIFPTNTVNIENINQSIQLMREESFDYKITYKKKIDGLNEEENVIYLSDNFNQVNLHPIQKNEYHIQALRYLKGMLIIAEHLNNPAQHREIFQKCQSYFNDYRLNYYRLIDQQDPESNAQNLLQLEENFASLLQEKNIAKDENSARNQVNMARDLGIMLESNHHRIATISRSENGKTTLEIAENAKISEGYYAANVNTETETEGKKEYSKWFQSAEKYAGFTKSQNFITKIFQFFSGKKNKPQPSSWLKNFFDQKTEALSQCGVPAPPSARWLPIPGNIQDIIIHTFNLKKDNTKDKNSKKQNITSNKKSTKFTRTGIISAFLIDDINEQKRLAKEFLKEILTSRIIKDLEKYKANYGVLPDKFFVDYQTLLSPNYIEEFFYKKRGFLPRHKDNNAAFVKMAKEIINELDTSNNYIESDTLQNYINKTVHKKFPVKLEFCQTNSAVNTFADIWGYAPSIKEYDEDTHHRHSKIQSVNTLIQKLSLDDQGKKLLNRPEVLNQVMLRFQAASYLRRLLDKKNPYQGLPTYQRDIMQAALECLTVGDQGTTLLGCKSARDRTAVIAAAIKTMLEDASSMRNWESLNEGIIRTLKEGQNFRAMNYHVAMVKLGDVHPYFMKQLDPSLNKEIKEMKPFSKKIGKPAKKQKTQENESAKKSNNSRIPTLFNGFYKTNNKTDGSIKPPENFRNHR